MSLDPEKLSLLDGYVRRIDSSGAYNPYIVHASTGRPAEVPVCGNKNYYKSDRVEDFKQAEKYAPALRGGDVRCKNCLRNLGY